MIFAFQESRIPSASDLVVVPMDISVILALEGRDERLVDISQWFLPADSERVARDLWSDWLQAANSSESALVNYSYVYQHLASSLHYWQHVVDLAFLRYQPISVALPLACQADSTVITTSDDLLLWVRAEILRESARGLEVTYVGAARKPLFSRWRLQFASRDMSWVANVLRVRRVLRSGSAQAAGMRRRASNVALRGGAGGGGGETTKDVGVVIIGQRTKRVALVDELVGAVDFEVVDVADILNHREPSSMSLRVPISLESGVGAVRGLWRFIQALMGEGDGDESQITDFVSGAWKVLLTDHEYDPAVRRLVDLGLASGKSVAFFPEGAQWPVDGGGYLNEPWHHDVPGVTRFLLGDAYADASLPTKQPASEVVTGYLGDTFKQDHLADVLVRARWGVSRKSRRARRNVLVDLFASRGPGLGVAGLPCELLELEYFEEMINSIDSASTRLIVKHRSPRMARYLSRKHRGAGLSFIGAVPWQSALAICDAVLIRDSSIGIESLALGKPVVIYRPVGVTAVCDFWAQVESDVLRVVDSPSGINAALVEVTSGELGDYWRYEPYFSRRQGAAREWVVGQIGRDTPSCP